MRRTLGTLPPLQALALRLAGLARRADLTAEERLALVTLRLALRAAANGNLGVGCVIVDPAGSIVARGENRVFAPRFRSSAHAEMVALDAFERRAPELRQLGRYTLVSSLECCMMCLGRIIQSGIGKVTFVAPDPLGGMLDRREAMPPIFRQLSVGQGFSRAQVRPGMVALASALFEVNAERLHAQFARRRR